MCLYIRTIDIEYLRVEATNELSELLRIFQIDLKKGQDKKKITKRTNVEEENVEKFSKIF